MPKRRHKPEEIVAKLRQADVLASQGVAIGMAMARRVERVGEGPIGLH